MSSSNTTSVTATTALAAAAGMFLLGGASAALLFRPKRAAPASRKKKRTVQDLVRPNILALQPYRCARDDYDSGILLDANENSIGATVEAPPDDMQLNRYPCPYQFELKELIANYRGIKKEQIFLGVGSDEAIDLIIRVFCEPRVDNIMITPPTYGMYKVCAAVNDVPLVKSPLTPDFDVDVDALMADVTPNTKVLFLCSPGNPTAKAIPKATVEAVLRDERYDGIVVLDEAYVDFSPEGSACQLVDKYPKLIVMQTLSKAFGLAGIRLGMAISNEATTQILNNVKAPYNISKLTSKQATGAFRNLALLNTNMSTILSERERVAKALAKMSFVQQVHPSHTNFLLVQMPKAKEIYLLMAEAGVVLRFRGHELHCAGCLRITIGTPAENDAMLKMLQSTAADVGVTTSDQ